MNNDRHIGGRGGGSEPAAKKAGPLVAAAVLAGSMAVAGGGVGAGGASLGGSSSTGSVSSSAGKALKARKARSKSAARDGRVDVAWRRMGVRRVRRNSEHRSGCLAVSFGQVREFFVHTPCRSLDRALFGLSDGNGNIAAVSVVRVTMRSRGQARDFRQLIDIHGTGDITPLGGVMLKRWDIRFTGLNYDSAPRGRTIVVVETETASGHFSGEALDAIAEVAAVAAAATHR